MFRAFLFSLCFLGSYLAANCCCSECNDCYVCDYLYVGGNFDYVITYLPQNKIIDSSSAFENDTALFIGPQTQRSKRSNYRWNVYLGYERVITCNWRIGLELGYRDLGQLKTEYLGTFDTGNGISDTGPFRQVDSCSLDALLMAKYQFCSGLNIFAKIGAALVLMELKEGNFISTTPNVSFLGPFAVYEYKYRNIYPEITGGAGYRLFNCINVVATLGFILGPFSGYNFIEGFTNGNIPALIRPEECPGYGYFTVGIEIPFNFRNISRLWKRPAC